MDQTEITSEENPEKFNEMANPGRGKQGVDKDPGKEESQSTENVVIDTQKGKGKVDGDPSKETDQPIEQP
ncbi:MAG: hypothetical protein M3Y85_00870 [Bacteroidota bacterium]|nr:hypothetical protein [Bacteroidota bacterium]